MAEQQGASERVRDTGRQPAPTARVEPRFEAPNKPPVADEAVRDVRTARPIEPAASRPGPPAGRRRRFPWAQLLAAAAAAALVVAGAIYWWSIRNEVSTDDAYTDGNVVIVAPHVTGYVVGLAVNDNEFVHKGQLLVQIDPRDFIAARDQAKGQLALAEAQLRNSRLAWEWAKTTYPARLEAAEAQLASAKANQFKAEADYQRYRSINPAATTREQLDAATAAKKQADAQVLAADAQVKEARLVPLSVGEAEQQVSQWQAQVSVARAQLDQAELNLGYTDIVAPEDGWVTRRNVVAGNHVQAGTQIMALVSPEIWITANFKETQLTRMRPGQRVAISVDAYPLLDLAGHVDSIQEGSGAKFSAFPPENATGNYVKIVQRVPVKIVIDRGLDPNRPLPLGLSVVPTVHLE
jgi:membrane fusion protein, multidrug efflux system